MNIMIGHGTSTKEKAIPTHHEGKCVITRQGMLQVFPVFIATSKNLASLD